MKSIRTVLCPLDFSTPELPEVQLAVKICQTFDARLVLEHNFVDADGNDTATLTATLSPRQAIGEESGTVSELTRILFKATIDGTNTAVDALDREAVSDATGKAITTLVGRTPGLIRITATVDGLPNITDTVLIEFK